MPSREHGLVGQICWVCEQPIYGTGIFDKPPDDVGVTSYHEGCWLKARLTTLLPERCFVVAVDHLNTFSSSNTAEARVVDSAGKSWSFPLEFTGTKWTCAALRADLFTLMNRHFLLIKIEDDDAGNSTG